MKQDARRKIVDEIKNTITDSRGLVKLSRELARLLDIVKAHEIEELEKMEDIQESLEKKEKVAEEKKEIKEKLKAIGGLLKESKKDVQEIREVSSDSREELKEIIKDHQKMMKRINAIQAYLEKTTKTAQYVDDLIEGMPESLQKIKLGLETPKIVDGIKIDINEIIANFYEIYTSFFNAQMAVDMTLWDVWHLINFSSKELAVAAEMAKAQDELIGEVVT